MGWTEKDIPDLSGQHALVTGATAGLGRQTALELHRAGADVTLAVRSASRGEKAIATIRAQSSGSSGSLTLSLVDLADLGSVRAAVERHRSVVDILVANAGIMMVPHREITVDGFESQFGTNHLGHFALIGGLLPWLSDRARVVSLSSMAHRGAGMYLPGANLVGKYTPMSAYSQSKLATAMFGLEFDRRLRAAGSEVRSVIAHPGWCATDLFNRTYSDAPGPMVRLSRRASAVFGSSVQHGARPQLMAATAPDVVGGAYLGPRFLLRGAPSPATLTAAARDPDDGRRLWEESAELTGEAFDLDALGANLGSGRAASGSAVAGSAATDSTVTDSTATDSTATESTEEIHP